MKRHLPIFILLIFAFSSCHILQNASVAKKPIPEWVKAKPVNSFYYTGIGSASKAGFAPADYTQTAQQQALGDLSREISVNISSSSVLSIMEHNYNITENWSSEITASSDIFLEGYEMVETWEDKDYYWVYYRLSKDTYARMKSQRKTQAINDATVKFNEGKKQLSNNAYNEALRFYADAMIAIKPYMNEATETIIDGKTVDIGQQIFLSMISLVQSLQISYPVNEINIKRGICLKPELRTFYVYNDKKQAVANVPVEINFSSGGLNKNRDVTDNTGKIICDLNKITSSNKNETLSLSLDMLTWSRVTKDPFVRNIIKQIPVGRTTLLFNVEKAGIYISGIELTYNNQSDKTILSDAMRGSMATDNIILDNDSLADFKIRIESNTQKKESDASTYTSTIEIKVFLTDANNELMFQKRYTTEGEGSGYQEANENAYKEASVLINRKVSKEINSLLYSNLP